MRIIGGNYKGLKLRSNNEKEKYSTKFLVRPTSDRVKETVFNILENSLKLEIIDSSFLDIFSGSGALGIEALSRGSNYVHFIDKERSSCRLIKENLKLLSKADLSPKPETRILEKDFFDQKLFIGNKFDFIYLDPPYNKFCIEKITLRLKNLNVLKTGSIIIYESSLQEKISKSLNLIGGRKIGKTYISFFKFSH